MSHRGPCRQDTIAPTLHPPSPSLSAVSSTPDSGSEKVTMVPSLSSGLSAAAAFPDSCRGIEQSLIAVQSGTQPRRGQPPLPLEAPLPVQTHSSGYIGRLQSGKICSAVDYFTPVIQAIKVTLEILRTA
uniref:Uncharacterized protein n=1 Tax=Oryza glumipatula TaxID=40148 RepID=A0A0D9ZCZ1_9ORYZ